MDKNLFSSSLKKIKLENIKNKRWAIFAVIIGSAVGFLSVAICVYGHLTIFGFNIAYVVSPLIAGFVETYIAKSKHGNSTGAISAIVLFISINVFGWVFPANPITLNLFTLGGLALAVQAAFPILINYLIFVVFLGALTYALGYLGDLMARAVNKIQGKVDVPEEKDIGTLESEKWNTLLINTPDIQGKRVVEYMGLVNGESIMAADEEDVGTLKKISGDVNYERKLEKAVINALKIMDEEASSVGANAVLEVQIDYSSVGGIKGKTLMVSVVGNAVKYE
ncbi:YbjQ family protein [Methanobacterium aggregans]|uniref:YbjQ family protein n=1 Tax=Methanobacterium aggregans TaxID=1615586 RepID=UPI001AE208F6|nr:heavy metal-binding domain-containing protein [Methanobacterium aggregans]MBP2046424.1 uncharacterized protein YbjQ (UPF0145 family) [Methanobacterium aggregans]